MNVQYGISIHDGLNPAKYQIKPSLLQKRIFFYQKETGKLQGFNTSGNGGNDGK